MFSQVSKLSNAIWMYSDFYILQKDVSSFREDRYSSIRQAYQLDILLKTQGEKN